MRGISWRTAIYAIGAVMAVLLTLATLGRALQVETTGAWVSVVALAAITVGCGVQTVREHRRRA